MSQPPHMIDLPPTQFARSGDVSVAYQVFGEGPIDLVFVTGIVWHLEAAHELPGVTDFFQRLARFARVVVFDKRGQGLSDRVSGVTMDQRADDIRAVMEAVGMQRAVLCGYSEGAVLAAYFAAFHPELVSHLILIGGMPRFCQADDYPYGVTEAQVRKSGQFYTSGRLLSAAIPSWAEDPRMQDQAARYERLSCSPGNYKALLEMNLQLDARSILPQIRVPTLVLHRTEDQLAPIEGGRYFAANIPGAKLVERPGRDHWFSAGDYIPFLAEIEAFATGAPAETVVADEERTLATVLFTDIVGSTERAAELGDAVWRRTLDQHDGIVRRLVTQNRGRVVKSTGDGVLALFDGPGRALRCALALEPALARLQISVRAGLHTGEVIERGADVAGIAVHAAARVMAEAGPGEVLVSRVVVDLVAGSGVAFAERGEVALRGLPGVWKLFAAG
ncbi:MAG: adenylate/guanylate cyclase domain-containing protein [Hyphomonadaceae bacterium]